MRIRLRDRYGNYLDATETMGNSINWHNGIQLDFLNMTWILFIKMQYPIVLKGIFILFQLVIALICNVVMVIIWNYLLKRIENIHRSTFSIPVIIRKVCNGKELTIDNDKKHMSHEYN